MPTHTCAYLYEHILCNHIYICIYAWQEIEIAIDTDVGIRTKAGNVRVDIERSIVISTYRYIGIQIYRYIGV